MTIAAQQTQAPERYRLLAKSDWLFEPDVPGDEYGQIASPKEELLQSILRNPAIDPNDLPCARPRRQLEDDDFSLVERIITAWISRR